MDDRVLRIAVTPRMMVTALFEVARNAELGGDQLKANVALEVAYQREIQLFGGDPRAETLRWESGRA